MLWWCYAIVLIWVLLCSKPLTRIQAFMCYQTVLTVSYWSRFSKHGIDNIVLCILLLILLLHLPILHVYRLGNTYPVFLELKVLSVLYLYFGISVKQNSFRMGTSLNMTQTHLCWAISCLTMAPNSCMWCNLPSTLWTSSCICQQSGQRFLKRYLVLTFLCNRAVC